MAFTITLMIISLTFVILLYVLGDGKCFIPHFILFVVVSIFLSAIIGARIQKKQDIKSKSIIKPDIEVVCKNGKCDTTYIYKIK